MAYWRLSNTANCMHQPLTAIRYCTYSRCKFKWLESLLSASTVMLSIWSKCSMYLTIVLWCNRHSSISWFSSTTYWTSSDLTSRCWQTALLSRSSRNVYRALSLTSSPAVIQAVSAGLSAVWNSSAGRQHRPPSSVECGVDCASREAPRPRRTCLTCGTAPPSARKLSTSAENCADCWAACISFTDAARFETFDCRIRAGYLSCSSLLVYICLNYLFKLHIVVCCSRKRRRKCIRPNESQSKVRWIIVEIKLVLFTSKKNVICYIFVNAVELHDCNYYRIM